MLVTRNRRGRPLVGVAVALPAALAAVVTGGAAAAAVPAPPPVPLVTAPPPVAEATAQPAAAGARPAALAQQGEALVGTFSLRPGSCPGGSYFRMIQPGGTANGPFVTNTDSSCSDKTITPLTPGRDGGLVTGSYQEQPSPAFDATGGGTAARITAPQKFYGVNFATATNPTDPQSGQRTTPPAISHDGAGRLTGDLRAFAATWNNQHFNQGAPKPDGSTPGTTAVPTGTYDAAKGTFVLEWTSQIVGGPFNNFTGLWHLEGTFRSSAPRSTAAPAPAPAPAPSVGAAGSAAPSPAPVARPSGRAPLAATGPPFPGWYGVMALLAGMTALALVRRLHTAPPGTGRRGVDDG